MSKDPNEIELNRLAAIVVGSQDAIISKSLDGVVTSWNPAAARIFGFEAAEMIGFPITRIIPAHLMAEEHFIIEQIRQGINVDHFETVRLHKNGELIDISLTVSPLADASGKIVGASKIARDIGPRKMAEQAVRAAQDKFKLIALATSDVICEWDLQTGEWWWSDGLATQFGYPIATATQGGTKFWEQRIADADRNRIRDEVEQFVRSGDTKRRLEYQFIRADGSTARVVENKVALRNGQGAATSLLGSIVDVTERFELEARIRQSQKLEAIGQLTGGVAHDFNNLLTVMIGNAAILTENLSHDNQLRFLAEMMTTAAERGAELTARLLAFARRQPLAPKAIDVNQLLRGMEPLIRRTLPEDIDIEFVRGAGLWRASIDPGQLENAVLNLTINARDAMSGGGTLTIETANASLDASYAFAHQEVVPGQYVLVSISDSGTGMDAATIARAFDPFFTTKAVGKGSGLGLSMVYGFIKQSKGHVKLYSELGHGTTIKLYLPRAGQSDPEQGTDPVAQSVPGGTECVLLVEDDELVRDFASHQLEALGYRLVKARNGAEAMDLLRQVKDIDLLFTDVVMPGGMNGRTLAEKARQLRPNLAILFTSGYTENAIIHDGRLDRGVRLLSKPYRRQELAVQVRQALDAQKQKQSDN